MKGREKEKIKREIENKGRENRERENNIEMKI